ncbi:MAG: PKD domain-containing protein [Bacteroidota bacterium]
MRISSTFFKIQWLIAFCCSTTFLLGNPTKTIAEKENLLAITPTLRDTACGVTDTIFQATFPTCPGGADATATLEVMTDEAFGIVWDNESRGATGTNLSVGKHFVTVTLISGCSYVDSIVIADRPPLEYSIETVNALCVGVNNGRTDITDTVGLSYRWSTGDSTNVISNLAAGNYSVTISDTLGCTAVELINIGVDTAATLQVSAVDATCFGISNGAASANDTLNLTGYSYLWSNGDTTSSISGLAPNTYFVLATNAEGCAIADSVNVLAEREVALDINLTDATCAGVSDGAISINDTLDVTGFRFGWSTGDTVSSVNNLAAGDYTVVVVDTSGCLTGAVITVGNTRSLDISTVATDAACEVAGNGTVAIQDSIDITNLSIRWSSGDSTAMVTDLAPGTFTVMVTDTANCTAMDTAIVGITETLLVTATANDATCNGVNDGSITLNDTTGVEGLAISWSNGDSTQTIQGLMAGTYTYTVTDSLGCSVQDSVSIDAGAGPTVALTATDVSCGGLSDGSIIIDNPDSTLIYTWNTGDTTTMLSEIGTGTYEVTATDSMGCFTVASAETIATSSVNFALTKTNVTCEGAANGTITLTADSSASDLTIRWNTGDSTAMLTNLAVGEYTATVSDTLGCSTMASIEIIADSSLQISLTGNDIDCVGDADGRVTASVIGFNGNDGLTFVWNTGDSTATISNLMPGDYQVTVTDTTGCFGTAGVTLAAADSINITLVVANPTCEDTTGTGAILAGATGGSGSFTFDWSNGDSTNSINQLLAGTYILTVTDSLGCTQTDSATLVNPPSLTISATTDQDATCDGTEDGSASVIATGGTAPFTISWSNNATTSTINNLNPGTYTVQVSDDAGCEEMDTIVVGQTTNINVMVTELQSASGENATDAIATAVATGGQAPYTYNWDNGVEADTITNLSRGNHDVVATDANGCTGMGSIDIQFFELSVSIIEVRNLQCNGAPTGRATAAPNNGTAPFTYVWNTGDSTPILTNLLAGTYTVTVTDSVGLRGLGSVTLTQPEPIRFNLEITPPGCSNIPNGQIVINATGTVGNPLYDFGVGVTPNPLILGVTDGVKNYSILDGNGCRADTMFTIEALSPDPPTPNYGVSSLGLVATFTDSTLNAATSYLWKFGDGATSDIPSPIHQYPDTGDYEVCLIVSNTCGVDSLCRNIRIDPIPVPGVSLTFGRDTSSLSGTVVQIPVTVGAFEDVAGIRGAFELTNPAIGEIQAVRELNLPGLVRENIAITNNLINVNWSVADTNLVTLPPGTQIFVIDLLLTGSSDQCTQIQPATNESMLEFTKTFMGDLVPAPFVINSAEICIASTVAISGNISRESDQAISGVAVTNNGMLSDTTAADGNYAFTGLPGGTTFNISASKSDDLLEGVTAFDLVAILQHILTRRLLDSPYKIIAADVDNSGSVTSLDLVQLQRLILEQIDAFPNNQPWRFVPESYLFRNPSNPLMEDFPESIQLSRLEIDSANIDFVAIKTGDVTDSSPASARFLNKKIGFEIEEQFFRKGDKVTVPINITSKNTVLGFQAELDFDHKKLAFISASNDSYISIANSNLGTKNLEYGRLKILWLNRKELPFRTLKNGQFQLTFTALADGYLSEAMQLVSEGFDAQLFVKGNAETTVQTMSLVVNNAIETEEESVTPPTLFLMAGENMADGGCSDNIDNDNDGLIDCADADCFCECNTVESVNLIANPSAEMPVSNGWQTVQGTWTTRGANPSPQDGAAYFYPLNSETGQLSQVIDLSADADKITQGTVRYAFSGYVRSFDQEPNDQPQILIELRNSSDSTLSSYDSGIINSLDDWTQLSDTINAPVGSATAIINLIARRRNGNNNDAYFDNLSMTKIVDGNCEDPCEDLFIFGLTTPSVPNSMGGTASASLAGGTGPETYRWSTGDSTSEVTNLMPGTYTVEATDSIGCTALDSVQVFADSSFFLSLTGTDVACADDSTGSITVAVTGGTAPITFTWSDSTLSGDTLTNLPAGSYSVTATDSTGASVMASIVINSGSNIQLNTTDSKIVDESCPDANDGQLSLVAEGGQGTYQYILNNDTTDNGVYIGLAAGEYAVTISDSTGCSVVETVTVGNTISGTLSANFTATVTDTSVNLMSTTMDTTATYSWTFDNGMMSSERNPSVTYTMPGNYEICLTVTNDCGSETSCQMVTFGITGPVTFIVNGVNGTANDTVVVPITVQNFIDITSYQNTIAIQDTAIGRIVGFSNFNLPNLSADNFFQVDDFTLTNVWFDETGLGQSVTNNTVIFNLMVMIDAQVDTCVRVNFVDMPVQRQVTGIADGEVMEVPFETINDDICTRQTAAITGTITRETNSAVPGVQINVSNFDKIPTTDIDGNYLAEKLPLGNTYEVTPELNTPLLESVSTFDIVLMNRHILGTRLLDSPYKIIAADINQSGTITVFDLVLIQRAILGLNTSFPNNSAWRFIPRSYEFMDPTNPLAEDFPESITIDTIGTDVSGQDFVAIKTADVSYNIPTATQPLATSRSGQTLQLNVDNQTFTAGKTVKTTISTKDLAAISGFQAEFNFDNTQLTLVDIQPNASLGFTANNIGTKYLNQGKLQLVWVNRSDNNLAEVEDLLELTFQSKGSGELKEALRLDSRYLATESYTADLAIGKVALDFTERIQVSLDEFTVYPNPTKGLVDLTFGKENGEKVDLLLYNVTGQLVNEWKGIEGLIQQLDLTNFHNGTYLLILRKSSGVAVKRIVLNK